MKSVLIQVERRVYNLLRERVMGQVESQVDGRVWGQVTQPVWEQVTRSVWGPAWGFLVDPSIRFGTPVREQVSQVAMKYVREQVYTQVWEQTRGHVLPWLRPSVKAEVYRGVRTQILDQVWTQIRENVWEETLRIQYGEGRRGPQHHHPAVDLSTTT